MKQERILIYTDRNKQTQFETEVETVQNEALRLIDLFHSFQPWNKIKTIEDFEALCSDPIKAMDQTLIKNSGINPEMTGGKLPNPSKVAEILDIDRDNFINIIKGQKVTEACKPCNQTAIIIKQGKGVLSYTTFKTYQEYLTFDEGRFSIDENAISDKIKSFKIYAETPKQIERYNFWVEAEKTLNDLDKLGLLGMTSEFAKLTKGRFTFSFQSGKLTLDEMALIHEIVSLKN